MNSANADPFADIQVATRRHQAQHGCGAYTFEDGPALQALAGVHKPIRILELGTALGYTACCLAQGNTSASVDTLELDMEHVLLAREHIEEHGLTSRISVHHGEFGDLLKRLSSGYQMAFFDGFAPPVKILSKVRSLLFEGGILVCSNLQLAKKYDSDVLTADFNNADRWAKLTPIESGKTIVRVKMGT